jgi:hypothetical protein
MLDSSCSIAGGPRRAIQFLSDHFDACHIRDVTHSRDTTTTTTITTTLHLENMGNDGGSIPDRRDLVRNKPKAEQADKANQTRARWFFCALSKVRLTNSMMLVCWAKTFMNSCASAPIARAYRVMRPWKTV